MSRRPKIIPTCVTNFIKESEELACQEEKSVLHKCYEAKTSNFVMEAKSPVASSNLKVIFISCLCPY
ncbi:hypothetical protein JD844_023385 [Phrynosoma platyrhinos]|uniref:Uncharacterized protein n=1 Tax=Phrynosoma platyrhinos TaxID=52577 RepID=A0ABQ7SWJ7_PHRPL|nr:hypothetical protein JD844_023385 [Phrynosoma platyrhinos]